MFSKLPLGMWWLGLCQRLGSTVWAWGQHCSGLKGSVLVLKWLNWFKPHSQRPLDLCGRNSVSLPFDTPESYAEWTFCLLADSHNLNGPVPQRCHRARRKCSPPKFPAYMHSEQKLCPELEGATGTTQRQEPGTACPRLRGSVPCSGLKTN